MITAEDWIRTRMNIIDVQEAAEKLKQYGRLCAEEALKRATENTQLCLRKYNLDGSFDENTLLGQEICSERGYEYFGINKQSILNTPLDFIK